MEGKKEMFVTRVSKGTGGIRAKLFDLGVIQSILKSILNLEVYHGSVLYRYQCVVGEDMIDSN